MKKKLLPLIPYAAALVVTYYVLPLLARNTGFAMVQMLVLTPLLTFGCAALVGLLRGVDLLIPVVTAILFAPTVLIFYNTSAWGYIVAYAVIALLGNLAGRFLHGKR